MDIILYSLYYFSFIGFPPLSGFILKYYLILLIYSINTNLFFPFGLIIIVISTIVSGFYYLYLLISYFIPTLSNPVPMGQGKVELDNINTQHSINTPHYVVVWGEKDGEIEENWNINLLISLLTLFILFCSYLNPYLISFFYYLSI